MSRSYRRSVGGGALGLTGPWRAAELLNTPRPMPVRWRIARSALLTFPLAFVTGMIISPFEIWWSRSVDAMAVGNFAYQTFGCTTDQSFSLVMKLFFPGDTVAAMHDEFLFYAEIPYQLCAFAGAYVTTAGIGSLGHLIGTVASRL